MSLRRLACSTTFSRVACRINTRMASTIVGQSGRVYVQGEALQRHHDDNKFGIFKAESGNESFVFKRVPRQFYDLSLRLAVEFADSYRLRMHIDRNDKELILIYPYLKGTLLTLIQENPDLAVEQRKKILRHVGDAIQELHRKDWIHTDVKPDNILVNWACDEEGHKTVTDVVLGDFDIASKLEDGKPRQTPYAVGNVMWRSPEGQTGIGVTKASDVFSFGLVCIYTLGGGDFLLLNDYSELAKHGIMPEQEILVRHFSYFGSALEGLLQHVNNEKWCKALESASEIAKDAVEENPLLRFEQWGAELGSEAQNMISGMTNPDPKSRITIDQVMMHGWWQEE